MKRTSGVILQDDDLFLIVHRTGQNSITWTLPKGTVREGMGSIEVVKNKLGQLCNIYKDRYGNFEYLGERPNKYGNSIFECYTTTLKNSIKKLDIRCNHIVSDGNMSGVHAIDDYRWVDKETGTRFLPEHQSEFLELI